METDIITLREERAEIVQKMQAVLDKAETEKRSDLTSEEEKEFNQLDRQRKNLDQKIDGFVDTFAEAVVRYKNERNLDIVPQVADKGGVRSSAQWVDQEGNEVRVLRPDQKLADRSTLSGWSDFDLSKALRAMITGDYSQAKNEIRAMDLSGSAALVPTPISDYIIDKARDQMVLSKLGINTVPMRSSTLKFGRVTSDPGFTWKAENAAFTNGGVGIDGVVLTAKTLISGVNLSEELAEDAPNSQQLVEDTIARTLAHAIDKAGLVGSGSGQEPQGIYGYTSVTDTSLSTSAPDYDTFSDLYYRIVEANEMPNGLVLAPRTLQTLDQLKDTQGRYLEPPQSWSKFKTLSTNAIPTNLGAGTNESIGIMGDFSQLFYGVRQNLQIEVSREASSGAESAWLNLQVWVRVYARIDFQIARPAAFQTVSGMTT